MTPRIDIEDMTDAQDEAKRHVVAPWPTESILRIGELVDIRPDGSITYGPNYSPDEAAKALWDAIARMGFARLARPSQAGDERVAREARTAALREVDAIVEAFGPKRGNRWISRADLRAALAAMDTPKGGGDE